MTTMNSEITNESELVPVETPESETGKLLAQMGDDSFLASLESAAANAKRIEAAMQTILIAVTQPGDWQEFSGKACLGSAGAERYIKHFGISILNMSHKKDCFSDAEGNGYRYVYACQAVWNGRQVQAEGRYGTRDKFLGRANDQWRPTSEINENHIQNAAYHICIGNAVKTLLGLRGLEWGRLQGILRGQGENTDNMKSVRHHSGSQGGISDDEHKLQADCGRMLSEMNQGDETAMKEQLKQLTKFEGKDGKEVYVKSLKTCKGKWLQGTHEKVKKAYEQWQKLTTDGLDFEEGEQ